MSEKLFGKTLAELQSIVLELGFPKYIAKQLAHWMYQQHISAFEEMSNIPKKLKLQLAENYELGIYPPKSFQESVDGTKKYLYTIGTQKYVEAAYIPDRERATLCVSSQVGCKMGCLFCMTARQGFQGHLTSGEILNQIHSLPEKESLTNVVYMGMGEPFDNLDNVLKSIEILTAEWGYAWSPKRITVSTIGIIPAMKRFLENSKAHLAISLHSPFEADRKKIMPIENVYPLPKLLEALKEFDWRRQRRVSFEYIMFKGFNDSDAHIKELCKILDGIKCRINLLRFHPIPNSPLCSPSEEHILKFRDLLTAKGLTTTIRASRGEDIFAACGLLSTKELGKGVEDPDF